MKKFQHKNPKSIDEALALLTENKSKAKVIAGGSDLLKMMKEELETPDIVINLKSISGLSYIKEKRNGVAIGPLTTLNEVALNKKIQNFFPLLVEAIGKIGTPQIRNAATIGGSLCQRPRCYYFRGPYDCYRKGGNQCFAVDGDNRYHAIFSPGDCFIINPSDTATALTALNASAKISSVKASRSLSLDKFFIGPDVNITKENVLNEGEFLSEVWIPKYNKAHGAFFKISKRKAWDFAIISLAIHGEVKKGVCKKAKIILGGVSPIPWRAKRAEQWIIGRTINEINAAKAAKMAMSDSKPLSMNQYKTEMSENLIKKGVLQLL